jgi:chlorobactene glucosyltransferase
MLAVLVAVGVAVAATCVLLYQGVALLFAAQMPRLDPAPASASSASTPRVSVVVAARNEELDLPATLASLVAQDYPNLEIVVVEGGSTDGTARVIDSYAPRVRRVDEPPLPAGWVGKNWGCWTGAGSTSGEWLLFVDADVVLHPAAVRTTVEWALQEQAALATLASHVEMVGFWERTVLPFYVQMVLTYFRAPRVNRPRSRAAMANGQFWLTRRTDYDAVGGHAAVRSQIVEDVAIAQRYRAAGRALRIAWAPTLLRTRMYRDRVEMADGILRTVGGTNYSVLRQVGFALGLVGLFWLPLALLPVGIELGSAWIAGWGAVVAFALFGKHVVFARAVGAPAAYGLLYPVAVGFYLVLLLKSIARGVRHRDLDWKGRSYPVRR